MRRVLAEAKHWGFNRYADWFDAIDCVDPFSGDPQYSLGNALWDLKRTHFRTAQSLGLATDLVITPNHVYRDQLKPEWLAKRGPRIQGQLICPTSPARGRRSSRTTPTSSPTSPKPASASPPSTPPLRLRRLRLRPVQALDHHLRPADARHPPDRPHLSPEGRTALHRLVVDRRGAQALRPMDGRARPGRRGLDGPAHPLRPDRRGRRAAAQRLPQARLCPHRLPGPLQPAGHLREDRPGGSPEAYRRHGSRPARPVCHRRHGLFRRHLR